jgi:hypothetical protein
MEPVNFLDYVNTSVHVQHQTTEASDSVLERSFKREQYNPLRHGE